MPGALALPGPAATSKWRAACMLSEARVLTARVCACRCGPFDFKVQTGDENKPRNILEEIVW
jgi:hypothetical protein